MLMGCRQFHTFTEQAWTLLILNPFNAFGRVKDQLKTGEDGGWLTMMARWHLR